MSLKKIILVSSIAFILLALVLAILLWCNTNRQREIIPVNFMELVRSGDIYDLRLTMYSRASQPHIPWSEEDLLSRYDYKFVLTGGMLRLSMDTLALLDAMEFIPAESHPLVENLLADPNYIRRPMKGDFIVDARDIFSFELHGREVYRITMYGRCPISRERVVFVNGNAVEPDDIIYKLFFLFLPEEYIVC